jgi:DNA-binding transcriptional ArsR family regulator
MANNQIALNTLFHALADTTRRGIVQQLGRGVASVSELASPFDMALPSFMKHIGVLESSGLIVSQKVGRVRTCKLMPEKLAAIEKWYDDQRSIWENRYKNLDDLLTTLKGEQT